MGEVHFNPLDKWKLGEIIRDALVKRPLTAMPPPRFTGAGVYAIYFDGTGAEGYEALASINNDQDGWRLPVYVGKAVPEGARKGLGTLDATKGTAMLKRLREHAKSIRDGGLDLAHFRVRALMVEDIWIPLGETLTIVTFRPVWNIVLDGFGNKIPGKNRDQFPSWDILHLGRRWAVKSLANFIAAGEETPEAVAAKRTELTRKLRAEIGNSIERILAPVPKEVTAEEIEAVIRSAEVSTEDAEVKP